VLARERGLSIRMIRALYEGLGIPLEVLVRKPKRAA
jgi:antitoxin component HigA of HigAB toxin-antitoxin module